MHFLSLALAPLARLSPLGFNHVPNPYTFTKDHPAVWSDSTHINLSKLQTFHYCRIRGQFTY